ncbi:MAG TPA: PTS sugar transporter subunit IIC [Candidatus Enterocloster faecavium]|uniref:PTS sugar transporter subunit IIC n=1 Tax=Candidatus Enterocloster faecavium TaxID=2838560 RepID=A0A9D2L921_9FIRM|nr:PTS sugar transporter subunit IIC [Candidatus Enterocloster faecavium]
MIQSGLICALVWLLVQGIDRMLSWQTLQRPIVTATLTGLLLGDLHTGIVMAASLEAIFMGISAIGGSVPSDACASSIIAVAYTILTGADVETGLALAMPIGTLMGTAAEMWKPVQAAVAPYWERLAGSGNVTSFRAQVIAAGWCFDRLPQTIVLFAAIAFGVQGLEHVMNNMPAFIMAGLSASSSMMTGIGFAILISMIWNREIGWFFFIGYVLQKYLALPTVAIAIIAGVMAFMYFTTEKKFNELKRQIGEGGQLSSGGEEDLF